MRKLLAVLLAVALTVGQAQPAFAAWRPFMKGGRAAASLNALALTTPSGTAGVAGSTAITGATDNSTLTLTNTVGGLYSVTSGARTLNWTSAVVAASDQPVIRETLASASNSPRDTTVTVTIGSAAGYAGSCATANTGTAQHPHLLDLSSGTNEFGKTFTTAPSYNVMGVNCKAGPADGQVYKVWGVDTAPANTSYNGTSKVVSITGPTTIDGWDFDAAGAGIRVTLSANITGDVTIKNNNIVMRQAAPWYDTNNKNITGLQTIEKNKIDGNYVYGQVIYFHGASTPTQTLIRDNYFLNGLADAIQITNAFSRLEIKTNLWDNFSGAYNTHADLLQIYLPGSVGTNLTMTGLDWSGNTIVQGPADASGIPANFNAAIRDGGNDVTNITNGALFLHNVFVGIGNTGHAGAAGNIYPALATMLQGFGDATDSKIVGLTANDNWAWTEPGGAWQTGTKIGFANGPWQIGNATANQSCVDVSGNHSMSGLADPFTISVAC